LYEDNASSFAEDEAKVRVVNKELEQKKCDLNAEILFF
jgi:hypothetical protein